MASPRSQPGDALTPRQAECWAAYQRLKSIRLVAAEMGITYTAAHDLVTRARFKSSVPDGIVAAADAAGLDLDTMAHGWIKAKGKDGEPDVSAFFRTPQQPNDQAGAWLERFSEAAAAHAPDYTAQEAGKAGDHLLVISPADIQLGRLAEAFETGSRYDIAEAERRTREGVQRVLGMAAPFGIGAITVNTGNDDLDIDTPRRTTTAGTQQDTDGSIFSMADAGFWTWVWVVEEARKVAPVHVVFDPSNHPWVTSWLNNGRLSAWFRNAPDVTFDPQMQTIRHRKYQVYGRSLIGFTHGDGAKDKDLGQIMQHECREWWGRVDRGYWIVKHTHHKNRKAVGLRPVQFEKDYPGVTVIRTSDMRLDMNVSVEVVRSPASSSGWEDRNGYVGALRAVEAFIFHAQHGQITRLTWPFW
jgi:hypothetical protein